MTMHLLFSSILALAIILGQLIKLPIISKINGLTILDIVIIFLCLYGLNQLKFKLKKPPPYISAAILFIIIAIVSLILTPLHLTSKEYLTSFLYTCRFGIYILLGWLIFSGALSGLQKDITKIQLISTAVLTILGLLQFVFLPDLAFLAKDGWDPHYKRTVSTFLDPNFFGGFLVVNMLVLTIKNPAIGYLKNPKVVLIFFVLMYFALLTTFSRGSYLAFLISFITLSILKRSFKMGLLSLLLFVGLLLGFSLYQQSVATPRGVDRTLSARSRLSTWQQGGTIFQINPVIGIGFNAYRYALREYKLEDEKLLSISGNSTNDSSLLFVAATTGIVGMFAYMLFLAIAIFKNKNNFILTAGISGLFIQSFFINILFYPFILVWIILSSVNFPGFLKSSKK